MLNHLCLFLCPKTKKGLEPVTRGSKFIYEFGRNSTVYCFVASGYFKSPVISSTIKTPKAHIFMHISGLFLYYFTIKQNPYETPYTPPKCVKSV